MARTVYYTNDFEAHKNLSQKQFALSVYYLMVTLGNGTVALEFTDIEVIHFVMTISVLNFTCQSVSL